LSLYFTEPLKEPSAFPVLWKWTLDLPGRSRSSSPCSSSFPLTKPQESFSSQSFSPRQPFISRPRFPFLFFVTFQLPEAMDLLTFFSLFHGVQHESGCYELQMAPFFDPPPCPLPPPTTRLLPSHPGQSSWHESSLLATSPPYLRRHLFLDSTHSFPEAPHAGLLLLHKRTPSSHFQPRDPPATFFFRNAGFWSLQFLGSSGTILSDPPPPGRFFFASPPIPSRFSPDTFPYCGLVSSTTLNFGLPSFELYSTFLWDIFFPPNFAL